MRFCPPPDFRAFPKRFVDVRIGSEPRLNCGNYGITALSSALILACQFEADTDRSRLYRRSNDASCRPVSRHGLFFLDRLVTNTITALSDAGLPDPKSPCCRVGNAISLRKPASYNDLAKRREPAGYAQTGSAVFTTAGMKARGCSVWPDRPVS